MFKRPLFLLGLLLGVLTGFRLRLPKPRPSSSASIDFFADALIICDSAEAVVEANAAAQILFGVSRLPTLRYLTGQAVPPGRHPLRLAAVSRETNSGLYHCIVADGSERILDITARPLPDGKTAAVFCDVTAQHESKDREQAVQARQAVVQTLCRRLRVARTAEEMALAAAEETRALLRDWPDVQVKLFVFDRAADTLACLATAPDDRPKRPRSAAEARPQTVRFDAQAPELWQLYVAREPSANSLPLIAGGVAIGHVSVTSSAVDIFENPAIGETLDLITSLAALALAGASASAQAAAQAAQVDAVREITAAVIGGKTPDELADLAAVQIKQVTQAKVCTVSVPSGGKLCVMGQAYRDDLLFPQTKPNDPRLHSRATAKAWRTQKIAAELGLVQSEDAGPWRAFTGSAGLHSVAAVPLPGRRGVLSVYTTSDKALPDGQRKFLQTVAALLALNPAAATAKADGAG